MKIDEGETDSEADEKKFREGLEAEKEEAFLEEENESGDTSNKEEVVFPLEKREEDRKEEEKKEEEKEKKEFSEKQKADDAFKIKRRLLTDEKPNKE
jgi:hypothetical protein